MTHLKLGRRVKIMLSLLLALVIGGSIILYTKNSTPKVGEVPSVTQGLAPKQEDANPLIRPTSQPDWPLDEFVGEREDYPFAIGSGLDGEKGPSPISSENWLEIILPESNQPSIWAGNTFVIKGEELKKDQNLKAWIFPYDTSMKDEKSFTVDVAPNETTRDAAYNVPIPNNLTEGAYTLRVQTYEDVHFIDFLVIPYGAHHPR